MVDRARHKWRIPARPERDPTPSSGDTRTRSGASRGGSDDVVVESLTELKLRVQSLKEEVEHYRVLGKKATGACEDHRRELTLLRQKERALYMANEDKLRDALEHVLQDNTSLQARLTEQRQRTAQTLREQLRTSREQSERKATDLQAELDRLQEECREAHAAVHGVEQEKLHHEAQLREDVSTQLQLQDAMRQLRHRVADATTRLRVSSDDEENVIEDGEASEEEHGGVGRDVREPHRMASRARHGLFLPAGPTDPSRPRSPPSHHIVSLVSTVKRRNWVRPRCYYQRHGCDVEYAGGRPLRSARQSTAPTSPVVAANAAVRVASDAAATGAANASVHTPATCSGLCEQRFGELSANMTCASKYGGRAMNAACKALLQELAALRVEYMHHYKQLRDPHAASLEASRGLRAAMIAIDRKVEQVHALRRQQRRYSHELRVRDILRDVVRENRYCDALHADLLALLRAPPRGVCEV